MNPFTRRNIVPFLSRSFLRKSLLPLCLAGAIGLSGGPAWAQEAQPAESQADPIEFTEWGPVLERYVQDPVGTHEEIIALARKGTDGLPPMGLMFVGDAYLRAGNDATARRMFALVADRDPESREAALAHLGLGMISARTGDLSDARANFELAAQVPSESVEISTQLAQLGAAETAAAMGDHDQALEMLEKLAADTEAPDGVRGAARFARASALFDAERYEEAAEAFDEIAEAEGEAGRDARYAAARARLAGEGADDGRAALQDLVQDCEGAESGDPQVRNARGLRDLEPIGVLRTWIDNYRELSFDGFYGESAPLYQIGGCELARTTLASLEAGGELPRIAEAESVEDVQVAQGEASPPAAEAPAPAAPEATTAPATGVRGSWALIALLVAGGAAFLIWLRRKS